MSNLEINWDPKALYTAGWEQIGEGDWVHKTGWRLAIVYFPKSKEMKRCLWHVKENGSVFSISEEFDDIGPSEARMAGEPALRWANKIIYS